MIRKSFRLPLLGILITIGLICVDCKDSVNEPEDTEKPLTLAGQINTTNLPGLSPEDLTVYLGGYQASPEKEGDFDIQANSGTPGLAMAVADDTDKPVLFSLIPDPAKGGSITMNIHTTALSIVFMTPYVITSSSDDAAVTLSQIEALQEFKDFEEHLTQRMKVSSGALLTEDSITDSLFTRVVLAYIMTYIPDVPGLGKLKKSAISDPIIIDPNYEKGGLKVTHVQGDAYKITNSLGRWTYAVISPTNKFFVSPIGDLIDIFKGNRPFSPSETAFNLGVELGDEVQEVNVYGYGWHPDPENSWDALDDDEQSYARLGGMMTIFAEFIPAAISVILNVRDIQRGIEEHPEDVIDIIGTIASDSEFRLKLHQAIVASDPLGVSWLVFKKFMSQFADDPEFRVKVAAYLGIELSDAMLNTLLGCALLPIKAVNSLDAMVTVAKTTLGFRNGYFKTTFKIWREAVDPNNFGNIQGQVYDHDTSLPLEGASVELQGDESNPLNSRHKDVTNSDGAYYFENITVGTKTIYASKQDYNAASVNVNVVGKSTVTAPIITLSKESGSVSGRVLNDILVRHNVDEGLFKDELGLLVRETASGNLISSYTIYNGEYSISAPPGNYWIVAVHPDYSRDSVEVTVSADEHTEASKNLLLFPRCTMTGTIEYDMNNDEAYETTKDFSAFMTYGSAPIADEICPVTLGYRRSFISVMSFTRLAQQTVSFYIDVTRIKGPDEYILGAYYDVGCAYATGDMGVYLMDTELMCNSAAAGMSFSLWGDPKARGCNCDIKEAGRVYFDEFGSGLTDVIAGGVYDATLAGWRDCACSGEDTDNDGQNDKWDVDCARARLKLEFRIIVGSQPY